MTGTTGNRNMELVKFHIRKNDLVQVIAGKEKGKTGKVLKIFYKKNRVVVEKVNFVKKHSRPTGQTRQGGIIEKEAPIHVSNVLIVCPKCNRGVRTGNRFLEGGKKALICRKCGEIMERK
jgi:large subunit ribosomal protein L24